MRPAVVMTVVLAAASAVRVVACHSFLTPFSSPKTDTPLSFDQTVCKAACVQSTYRNSFEHSSMCTKLPKDRFVTSSAAALDSS